MTSTVLQALDLPAVAAWLAQRGVVVTPPLSATLIDGGRSNLTFFLDDNEGRRWVLRRPPLGTVLATAHDVAREFKVLSALASTDVPVPNLVGLGEDSDGTPFYVMQAVEGLVLRDGDVAADLLSPTALARTGPELIRGLAALHAVDPAAVGLERLGRGSEYLARQIQLWQSQAEHHRVRPAREADALRNRLLDTLPEQAEITLVHGDYKLDNVMVTDQGRLTAVLDWELCTRGDPLVDLAVCVYYWTEFSDPVRPFDRPPTLLPGMADRAELLATYRALTGRCLVRPNYYFGYAAWRLALVFEGVGGRARAGAYGDLDREEDRRLRQVVRDLFAHARYYLDRDDGDVD